MAAEWQAKCVPILPRWVVGMASAGKAEQTVQHTIRHEFLPDLLQGCRRAKKSQGQRHGNLRTCRAVPFLYQPVMSRCADPPKTMLLPSL